MRNFKTFVLIALMTLGFNSIQAQSKVAHINTQEVIEMMPEFKAMVADIEKYGKTLEDDLKTAAEDLQAKATKYQTEAGAQTDDENKRRQNELMQGEQTLRIADQQAQQDLGKRRNTLLEPILKKLNETIEAVAKEQGFDYVMDRTTLIIANGTDIKSLVLAKLNITE